MAGLIGKIGEFDSATEDWTSYLERLNHYLAANGIEEDKDTSLLHWPGDVRPPKSACGSTKTGGQNI